VAAWLLYQIRDIFPPLVLALAIIFILNPVVDWLERIGLRRTLATLAIYLIFIVVVTTLILLITPLLTEQVGGLIDKAPEYFDSVIAWADDIARRIGISEGGLEGVIKQGQDQLFGSLGQLGKVTLGAVHILLIFVLAPIFAIYLLIDLPRLQAAFVSHLPPNQKEELLHLLGRCGDAIGGFFRGQLLVALIVGIMSSVGLLIAGIPFWLPIGLVAGFFNIIPLVGAFIGGGLAVLVGAVSGGLWSAFWGAVVMIVVQQIDNHVISPNVMGRAVRLHPVTIMVALLAGATLAGLWGMLLAVPAAAVGKIVALHYYTQHVLGGAPEGMEVSLPPPEATDDPPGATEASAAPSEKLHP
jgi:predicted PurR-regulated permease PerM